MSQDARLDEEQATLRRARILGMGYVDTSKINQKQLHKDLLTVPELTGLRVIPLHADEHNIEFGVTNTTSQHTMVNLRNHFVDQRITFSLISDAGFREYMGLYNPPKQVIYKDITVTSASPEQLAQQVSAILEQIKASDMLAYLVQQAHKLVASDIHIETQQEGSRIRFRIDGVLHTVARLSIDKHRVLIAAIASAGNISTAAEDAQQGHIAQKVKMADSAEVDVNVRLETVKTINGMDVVMRLFNMEQAMYNLDKLGLSAAERKVVDDIVAKPSGLVLVVGPTGSGKTTTLYSMLNSLNNDERKIITIEDPVEYRFSGITQISVNSHGSDEKNFADRLRAVLRLDPDVVMVGEIRDLDTAKTALQASLTGHLVVSTFHASSAAAAVTRLMDVIGENPLFVSAVRLIMAQRLVRKLDPATKQAYRPTSNELQKISSVIETLPHGIKRPSLENLQLFSPGKTAENPFGYRGQIALREQFVMAGAMRALMEAGNKNVTADQIEAAASESGMITMLQDAILKVIDGETTLEEVYRVLG